MIDQLDTLRMATDYQLYANQYSKLATNLTPVQALSILSQNRVEIERVCTQDAKSLVSTLDTSLKDEYLDDSSQVIEQVLYNLHRTKDNLSALGGLITDKMRFAGLMEEYLLVEYQTENYLDQIYNQTKRYLRSLSRLDAIELLIRKVIEQDYPEEIGELSKEEIEENKQTSKLGRKLDSSAPQDKIREKVKELVHIKRFQKEDGSPKPTTIRDEIMNNHPELMGEVSERTLLRRVQKALNTLGLT